VHDLGILLCLGLLAGVALWRPWLGVLGLAFFGYLQPHTYASEVVRALPVYKVLFAATVVGAIFHRDWQWPPRDWRVAALLVFWLGLFVTTHYAAFPMYAWPRVMEVSAVLASTLLILVLIDTREKLFWLIAAIAASFALVAFKGGYWAFINGFADRVYGPPGSQYHDNNHFAVAAVMTIPLLVLWFRQTADPWLRGALALAIALSLFAALSSWSRGALLALGVMSLLLLVEGRKGLVVLLPVLLVAALAFVFLPEHWFARMESIANYQADGSALGRIEVWQKGLSFALGRPLLGAGFEGWVFGAETLDWHSAYVEIMAEHGLVLFGVWMSLILGTLAGLTGLAWRHRSPAETAWVADYAVALRASLVAYCVGGAFIGVAYWDLLYHLIAAAILLQGLASTQVKAAVARSQVFLH
jgi:probable O-glycosylation ligase (exosortase A-associated)